jgi:hypothetical protein
MTSASAGADVLFFDKTRTCSAPSGNGAGGLGYYGFFGAETASASPTIVVDEESTEQGVASEQAYASPAPPFKGRPMVRQYDPKEFPYPREPKWERKWDEAGE